MRDLINAANELRVTVVHCRKIVERLSEGLASAVVELPEVMFNPITARLMSAANAISVLNDSRVLLQPSWIRPAAWLPPLKGLRICEGGK